MGWSEFGKNVGERWGSEEQAKGYRKAGDIFWALGFEADKARSYADTYGTQEGNYRGEMADKLQGILTGEEDFKEDPGYQFVFDQAMKATKRKGASEGYGSHIGQSGNRGRALQDRAAGLASTEYDKIISRLMDLSGAGSENARAGANLYSDIKITSAQGQAEAIVGKHAALGNMNRAVHSAIGSGVDAIGGSMGGGMGSDIRLKKDLQLIGMDGPLHKYTWTWNNKAYEAFGLEGQDEGYIAQEVIEHIPEAVMEIKGYLCLDYDYINKRLEEVA